MLGSSRYLEGFLGLRMTGIRDSAGSMSGGTFGRYEEKAVGPSRRSLPELTVEWVLDLGCVVAMQ